MSADQSRRQSGFAPLLASHWDLSAVAGSDPARAAALERASTAEALVAELCRLLAQAVRTNTLRLGWEESRRNPTECRAVIQWWIGAEAFDWFMNGRAGYRAMFRKGFLRELCLGLDFNQHIVIALRAMLADALPESVSAIRLNCTFDPIGPITLPKADLLASLVPHLSKVWAAGRFVGDAADAPPRCSFNSGVQLIVDGDRWSAPWADDANATLDLKGAFIGGPEPYQPKDPEQRALTLATTGTA
ncbi:MAG: hypothetical protein IT424_09020 [Pirellulales bacterium]|nr:hypothetical protein [Pirellulales bacterium]